MQRNKNSKRVMEEAGNHFKNGANEKRWIGKEMIFCLLSLILVCFFGCRTDEYIDASTKINMEDTIIVVVSVTSISLDKSTLTLLVGEEQTLTATITPDNTTNKTVTWTSSDTSKATVDNNGKVAAISEGNATITAKVGNQEATCAVTIKNPLTYDDGVIINGIKWATRNVALPGTFAANPEDAGMFYQWNRKVAWPATGNVTNWNSSISTGITWEKANDPSPAGWHVPTIMELSKLLEDEKVSHEWTTVNGVNGRRFTDKATGNFVFLPAAGVRDYNGTIGNISSYGYYWNSLQYDSDYAYFLMFNSDDAFYTYLHRYYGFSVRSVAD